MELCSPGYPKLPYHENFQKKAENMDFHGIASCATLRHTIISRTTAAHCGHLMHYKYTSTTTTTIRHVMVQEFSTFEKI